MPNQYERTQLLIGASGLQRLKQARVAIFGIGGVGGYAAEALARSGVGALDLIDNDTISLSNINRQLIALHSTIGRFKVDVAAERIRDIDPNIHVEVYKTFYLKENAHEFDFGQYDYVIDAIDTVAGKIQLTVQAAEAGTPIISSMGAGNKLDPTMFEVADIYSTSVCPLARVMRRELRKRGIDALKVVCSKEEPLQPIIKTTADTEAEDIVPDGRETANSKSRRRQTPGSCAFVPSVAGLIIASEVIKDLLNDK